MARGFSSRLRGLGAAVRREVASELYAAADAIKVEAQLSITAGSISGSGHVPSQPGDPPNNDSGVLANGIVIRQTGELAYEVASTAPHAAFMEYGTSRVYPRPYMEPAALFARPEVERILNAAARRGVRRHLRS